MKNERALLGCASGRDLSGLSSCNLFDWFHGTVWKSIHRGPTH